MLLYNLSNVFIIHLKNNLTNFIQNKFIIKDNKCKEF